MATFGLEVVELSGENLGLSLRIVDYCWPTNELHGGVVAGRHSVLIGRTGLGTPVRRDIGLVAHHGQAHSVAVST